jgi:hypothetical protein
MNASGSRINRPVSEWDVQMDTPDCHKSKFWRRLSGLLARYREARAHRVAQRVRNLPIRISAL